MERKDWSKMSKHIPFRMTSRYSGQIEPDKQGVHWLSGNMLVPMIDIRTDTVNRTWLQNKLSPSHRVMIGFPRNLIFKLPMPVDVRMDATWETEFSIREIKN